MKDCPHLGIFQQATFDYRRVCVASICISSGATKKLTHCCVMAQPPSVLAQESCFDEWHGV